MSSHRKPRPRTRPHFPSLYFPSPRAILGCRNGRIFWFKTGYMTGFPLDEASNL